MFTVKHIDTDGSETLYTASKVEKANTGCRTFGDGIFLDREPATPMAGSVLGGEVAPYRAYAHCIPFSMARSSGDTDPVVYVMNEAGATVATYRL